MHKSDTAIWICSSDLCSILWRNEAADAALANIVLFKQGVESDAEVAAIKQCADTGELYSFPSYMLWNGVNTQLSV